MGRVMLALLLWSSCLLEAAGKELMRSRCSACEAMATELQEWFYPETAPKAFAVDPDAPPKRPDEKDENGLSPESAPPPPPTSWRELPSGIGALKTVELLEGLCSKVEVYELMGRSTQNTELESSGMVWQRADPNNMAHKVNPRIGEERVQIKAYCDEILEKIEDSVVDHIETGEAGPIKNARTFLCEEQTQECVGNAKERLAQRLAAEEKQRLAKQAVEGREVKGAHASTAKQPANWTDMGAGCCGDWDAKNGYPRSAIFSEQLGDLISCKGRCEATPECNYVNSGWEHAPNWCMLLGDCLEPLDSSPTGCGSSGANGVHTWKIERPSSDRKSKKSKKKKSKKKKKGGSRQSGDEL